VADEAHHLLPAAWPRWPSSSPWGARPSGPSRPSAKRWGNPHPQPCRSPSNQAKRWFGHDVCPPIPFVYGAPRDGPNAVVTSARTLRATSEWTRACMSEAHRAPSTSGSKP
jgi:hypothetical protein